MCEKVEHINRNRSIIAPSCRIVYIAATLYPPTVLNILHNIKLSYHCFVSINVILVFDRKCQGSRSPLECDGVIAEDGINVVDLETIMSQITIQMGRCWTRGMGETSFLDVVCCKTCIRVDNFVIYRSIVVTIINLSITLRL